MGDVPPRTLPRVAPGRNRPAERSKSSGQIIRSIRPIRSPGPTGWSNLIKIDWSNRKSESPGQSGCSVPPAGARPRRRGPAVGPSLCEGRPAGPACPLGPPAMEAGPAHPGRGGAGGRGGCARGRCVRLHGGAERTKARKGDSNRGPTPFALSSRGPPSFPRGEGRRGGKEGRKEGVEGGLTHKDRR